MLIPLIGACTLPALLQRTYQRFAQDSTQWQHILLDDNTPPEAASCFRRVDPVPESVASSARLLRTVWRSYFLLALFTSFAPAYLPPRYKLLVGQQVTTSDNVSSVLYCCIA